MFGLAFGPMTCRNTLLTTKRTEDAVVRPFQVIMTCSVFEPGFRAGGPIRSIARIIDTVPTQVDIAMFTSDRDIGDKKPYAGLSGNWVKRDRSSIFYLNPKRPSQWLTLLRRLRTSPSDLLYCNSLWDPVFTIIPVIAARLAIIPVRTILIAPRGELSPGALSLKPRKKAAFLRLWRPVLTTSRTTWHASTEDEAADIRAVWPDARIQVVEDQTDLPRNPTPLSTYPTEAAAMVFISRVSPMKNLDLTLNALKTVTAPIDFDIFGPIEDEHYWAECQRIITEMPENIRVSYKGRLAPQDVCTTFSRYDAFIFPTKGENFGHVIAESLSASCPVICSDKTPWTHTLTNGGGEALPEVNERVLGSVLQNFAATTPDQRLHRRKLAGSAYEGWRSTVDDENILERYRTSLVENTHWEAKVDG